MCRTGKLNVSATHVINSTFISIHEIRVWYMYYVCETCVLHMFYTCITGV